MELTEREKRFLALAIQGLTLRQGPIMFPLALAVAAKLGVGQYLEEYLQSWLTYEPELEQTSERR